MSDNIKDSPSVLTTKSSGRMLAFPLKDVKIDPGDICTKEDFNFSIGKPPSGCEFKLEEE